MCTTGRSLTVSGDGRWLGRFYPQKVVQMLLSSSLIIYNIVLPSATTELYILHITTFYIMHIIKMTVRYFNVRNGNVYRMVKVKGHDEECERLLINNWNVSQRYSGLNKTKPLHTEQGSNKQENKVVRPVSVFARSNKMKSWIFFISVFVLFLYKAFLGD